MKPRGDGGAADGTETPAQRGSCAGALFCAYAGTVLADRVRAVVVAQLMVAVRGPSWVVAVLRPGLAAYAHGVDPGSLG